MGFERYYFAEQKFMLTKIAGAIDDVTLMEHVMALQQEVDDVMDLRELADCREITSLDGLTVKGTCDCAKAEQERPESLLAILVTESDLLFGLARAFATFSAEKRKEVRIFKQKHEALAWLARDEDDLALLIKTATGV